MVEQHSISSQAADEQPGLIGEEIIVGIYPDEGGRLMLLPQLLTAMPNHYKKAQVIIACAFLLQCSCYHTMR
jgi:hypothetical protein